MPNSIQNRLLFIYTAIFTIAFILFAAIVYYLPRTRLLSEVDSDLQRLTQVLMPVMLNGTGSDFPEDLINLETASTFVILTDSRGEVLGSSRSLSSVGFRGLLDPSGLRSQEHFSTIKDADTFIRVLTVPVINSDEIIVGYIQVARLLDSFERFNDLVVIALLIGLGAATASLFLTVWLTPSLFRPLEEIATVARQITNADDLDRRVPNEHRSDQIGDLARALNQTLERLERLFQAQQRLTADVSHELRTPLTAIRGNVDLMRRIGETDPESLVIIQDEVERMTRLVGDLMLLARADAGSLPIVRKPVELDTILLEVIRQLNLLEDRPCLDLEAIDQVQVIGDADRLKQLLFNLIGNAIKYTASDKNVGISLQKDGHQAKIMIRDAGIGIPKEDLPHIFDRFYRVDKARARASGKGGGAGLGLSIAQWIAKAHGGQITVISEVGVGSTFTIHLPRIVEDDAAEEVGEILAPERGRPAFRMLNPSRIRTNR